MHVWPNTSRGNIIYINSHFNNISQKFLRKDNYTYEKIYLFNLVCLSRICARKWRQIVHVKIIWHKNRWERPTMGDHNSTSNLIRMRGYNPMKAFVKSWKVFQPSTLLLLISNILFRMHIDPWAIHYLL